MLVEERHLIKVGTRTIKHYRNLGYDCNFKDEISVLTSELSKGSNQIVTVKCDYCGNLFYPKYASYINNKEKNIINKDCCSMCKSIKTKEVCNEKYGVSCVLQLEDVQSKRRNTMLNKYGVDNIAKLPKTIEKMKNTCIERYGKDNYRKTDICNKRIKSTCIEKYGVDNPSKVEEFKHKKIETSLKHYGTKHPSQNKDVMKRCLIGRNLTFYKNGSTPTSSQQIYVFNLLNDCGYNVILNYPEDIFSLDIALFVDDLKIDIEYDGWFWHQNYKKDECRNQTLINNFDWKILRIKSGNLLPTNKQLLDAINLLINTNSKYEEIVLSDWK